MILTHIARELARGARARRAVNSGVRILTYHGVTEQHVDPEIDGNFHTLDVFREHVRALRHCRVLALDELDHELARWHVRPAIAITFDDGFKNNLVAAEILASARLPFAVFVSTGNVSAGEPIWPSLLRLVLRRGSARTIALEGAQYHLDDQVAFRAVRKLFKEAAKERRLILWAALIGQLHAGELEELVAGVPSLAMLSWDEVRQLDTYGATIGSHGIEHELHHEAQQLATRAAELLLSKRAIEHELARPCTHFAFPNGTMMVSSGAEARASGYRHAYSVVSRSATARDDAMSLPRITASGNAEKLIAQLVFGN